MVLVWAILEYARLFDYLMDCGLVIGKGQRASTCTFVGRDSDTLVD